MSGGKRFADDFDRIDAVKPNDRILIQDSDDGNVKFANPSQLPKVEGGGGSSSPQIMMGYAVRGNEDKNTPAFWIKGLTGSLDQYRVFFYRHIKSRRRKRGGEGPYGRYTCYGWIHPADRTDVADEWSGSRGDVMINENLVNERVIMTEFGLRLTDTSETYTLVHLAQGRPSNMRGPDAPISAKDIISPYVWVTLDKGHEYNVRVSFGRTHRGGAIIYPGGRAQFRLRNMGFALVRITDQGPEIVTDILPFTVRFQISTDRNGFAYITHE